MADPSAAMTALVEFQIRADETNMDDWLDEWQKRAQDALEAEPETTAYAAAVSLDDESSVLIYERYAQGTASLNFHVERPSHDEAPGHEPELLRCAGLRVVGAR
jgi:quinol monooxygenase YgiN